MSVFAQRLVFFVLKLCELFVVTIDVYSRTTILRPPSRLGLTVYIIESQLVLCKMIRTLNGLILPVCNMEVSAIYRVSQ